MVQQARKQAGLTQVQLATAVGYTDGYLSQMENGRRPIPPALIVRMDEVLKQGGDLIRAQVAMADAQAHVRNVARLGAAGAGVVEVRTEAGTTDRREFGGATVAAMIVAATSAAGVVSDEMARADPTPRELSTLEADTRRVWDNLNRVPPDRLLPAALSQWNDARTHLRRDVSNPPRGRLNRVACTTATSMAILGNRMGRSAMADTFADLAGQYAARSGNPIMIGRVAGLRAILAADAGDYDLVVDVIGPVRREAHPSQRARLTAFQAEAYGQTARVQQAHDALADMRADLRHSVGFSDAGAQLFTAMTLTALGDPAGHEYAVRAAGWLGDDTDGVGLANVTAGRALLLCDHPDPVAAAGAGRSALRATAEVTNAGVAHHVAGLHRDLADRWPDVAEVRQLGDAVTQARHDAAGDGGGG
jgi:hypothetical protein